MSKLRVFISSVQKELENERLGVLSVISTDPFLQAHCEPVLYEFEPASSKKAVEECLALLGKCDICLTIIWREYGYAIDDVSITRQEYRLAKSKKLPILAFIKGDASVQREQGTAEFIKEIGKDGLKYKRFGNLLELLKEVRIALVKILKEHFAVEPTSDEDEIAEQNLEAASDFETKTLKRLRWEDLDHETVKRLVASAEKKPLVNFLRTPYFAIFLRVDSSGTTRIVVNIMLPQPALCFSLVTLRLFFRIAEFWPTPIAVRNRMATQQIKPIFASQCRWPSKGRLLLLNVTRAIPFALSVSIASVSTNIRQKRCAKHWSMQSLIAITKTARAK